VSPKLPRIFVASSTEQLKIAYAIQELLEFDGEVTVWTEGTFKASSYTLDDLLTSIQSHQFGVFVFVSDDRVTMRGQSWPAVRDNLVFEFGLFIGARGRQNCFFVLSRGTEPAHLPTDLAGLMPLSYAARRTDDNLLAALGPACNQIRRRIAGAHDPVRAAETFRLPTAKDSVETWQRPELTKAREVIRQSSLDAYDPDADMARKLLSQLFAFLESMADAVISGRIDDADLRETFERPVRILWPEIHTALAPPNHADEWWDPPPKIAELYGRWTQSP
jgi:hypothetical protein